MADGNLVSIIIPVYNAEKTIQKTIISVAGQSYENIEIILVDDGSKDNSGVLCDQLASQDIRIKVIHIDNKGVSNARNVGLLNALGEFVAFVDADDLIDSDMISVFFKSMIDNSVDLVIAPFKRLMTISNSIVECNMNYSGLYDKYEFTKSVISDYYFGYSRNKFMGSCWGKLFRRKILKDKRIVFDTNLHYSEDNLFIFEYICSVERVFVISGYYPYMYVIHENSAMSKIEKDLFQRRKYEINQYRRILGSLYELYFNRIYFIVCLQCYYNLSRLNYIENKKYIKAHLIEMLTDNNVVDSFKYVKVTDLTNREIIFYWLFKLQQKRILLLILCGNDLRKKVYIPIE